jgi:hypothetical protein
VKASENKKQTDPTASSPQEKPRSSPADPKAPKEEQENATRQTSKNEQALPPRDPGTPRKTRILPERQLIDSSLPTLFPPPPAPPAAPAPSAAEPPEPTATLADIGWMPPAEDQVARFLSDVADITPPPVREREGNRAAGFLLPSAISAEEAKRKKAKAEPFWSQVVATPMEHLQTPPAPARPRRMARKRAHRRMLWISLAIGILVLVLLSLAFILYKDPSMLHL